MADLVLLKTATMKKRLKAAIDTLFDGISTLGADGYRRSDKHSALLQAADNIPNESLARIKHLRDFIRVAEGNREPVLETAADGTYWEFSFHKLTQGFPLREMEAFIKMSTFERFLEMFANAKYTA